MGLMIESLVDAFSGIHEWSDEKSEDLLRNGANPHLEIRYWMVAARVFREFAVGRSMACRKELCRLLAVCNVMPNDASPMVFEKENSCLPRR
jgi:hypothetical protein